MITHTEVMLRSVGRSLALLGLVLVELPLLLMALALVASGILAIPLFPPVVGLVRRTADLTRTLCARWCGVEIERPYHPAPPAPVPQTDGWYRVGRTLYRTAQFPAWAQRWKWLFVDPATWRDFAWLLIGLLTKVVLAVPLLVVPGTAQDVYGRWTALLLSPTRASRLSQNMERLARVHIETVDSQAAEMRRIERDLHDGAQARLIALGMTLARAGRIARGSPNGVQTVLDKATEEATEALAELRRVVRGIHPPVLAERGLGDALSALGLDSPLTVSVDADLPTRPPAPIESAAYFAASELLTNAARHAHAERVAVAVSHSGSDLRVRVSDDGVGGVDPAEGTGISGIERRIASFGGTTTVSSPPGGPTTVTLTIPDGPAEGPAAPSREWWKTTIVVLCWSLAWLPLFPLGLVAAGFKVFDVEERAWFLPLYLPEPWQWPVIVQHDLPRCL